MLANIAVMQIHGWLFKSISNYVTLFRLQSPHLYTYMRVNCCCTGNNTFSSCLLFLFISMRQTAMYRLYRIWSTMSVCFMKQTSSCPCGCSVINMSDCFPLLLSFALGFCSKYTCEKNRDFDPSLILRCTSGESTCYYPINKQYTVYHDVDDFPKSNHAN